MTANKRNNTRIVSGLQKVYFAAAFSLLFAACGGDSGSGAKAPEPAEGADDGREVATLVDMGRCTSEREGDTVYVAEKLTDYLCQNKTWVDLSEVSSDMSSGKTDSDTKSSSSKGTGSTDETAPSSSDSDTDTPEGFVRENISVTGVAQKGPFKFGSPLNLYELKKNLTPSGTVYKDEISSNKGDFVIPKVSLVYPFAKLEVRGLYRNEVTGEWSTDSMTLRALTDFSEKRTEVNINLLTHLEYDRALYLVQNKGYSVYAAKKQAVQEIMTAFEFATAVTYSEDYAIFQNEGVSVTTSAGNATLLAISALVMGNRSDSEIQNFIDKFIADIKTDGEWNDLQTKATLADWAYNFDYSTIRASVKSWNILDIPAYETYLDIYWNNVYGLGGCSVNRKDVVAPNSNKLSKNYNKYFICNGTKWEVAERETAIGLCQNSNAGVVSKYNGTYYVCKNNAWKTATILEYDTYGLTGVEGDVKAGVVNKDKYYVYENGTWRAAANDQEIVLGVCTTVREGVVAENGGTYYICKSKTWATATVLEYDTYGWNAGEEGEMRAGSVNIEMCYEYKNGVWAPCLGSFLIDSRDGKTYKTVIIGTQTWMAENLNYVSAQSFCYNGIADNCTKYGRLYSWSAAMDSSVTGCRSLDVCSPTYPVRGICPKGWHLPDSTEWEVLFSAVGGKSIASKVLRSTSGWKCYYDDQCWNGIDAFGFSALSAGYWYGYGGASSYFEGEFTNALFWSSTQARSPNTSLYAYCRIFYSSKDDVDSRDQCRKVHRLSIRCLQDSN